MRIVGLPERVAAYSIVPLWLDHCVFISESSIVVYLENYLALQNGTHKTTALWYIVESLFFSP